jgi:hypothetical protein
MQQPATAHATGYAGQMAYMLHDLFTSQLLSRFRDIYMWYSVRCRDRNVIRSWALIRDHATIDRRRVDEGSFTG